MDDERPGGGSLVVSGVRVRVSGAVVRIGPVRPTDAPTPEVRVVRDGDVIRTIQVVCTCGERIAIRCEY